jgi:hypothetical protein
LGDTLHVVEICCVSINAMPVVKSVMAISPPMILPTIAGVTDLREVGKAEEDREPDDKDEGANIAGESSKPGLLKRD